MGLEKKKWKMTYSLQNKEFYCRAIFDCVSLSGVKIPSHVQECPVDE